MLLVRRFAAPAGGFFTDPDRAAGVFGVTGTGFAVLLAFVIFLSFSSYDRAREKASVEAVAVSQLFRTANLFSPHARRQVHGELICYARGVVSDEWRTMRDARESPVVDGWLARIDQTVDGMQLQSDKQRLGFDPREPAFVQALMIGAVTTMVVAGMLVVRFLNRPYTNASGSIRPTAMTTTLREMERRNASSGGGAARLCDERG